MTIANKQTYNELIAKRDELKQRLEKIKQDFKKGLDADSGERAVQLENADVLNEIARTTEEELLSLEEKIRQFQ